MTKHKETLIALRRIEGQIRGIQRMVEAQEYCIDIITQIQAASKALSRVGSKILEKHMCCCVTDSFKSKSLKDCNKKISELVAVLKRSQGL